MTTTLLENGEPITELDDDATDLSTCRDCSDEMDPNEVEINEIDGDPVCPSCYDNYVSCNDCSDLVHTDDAHTVNGDDLVCDSCNDNYYECDSCNERIHGDYTCTVGYDGTACESCRDNYYSFCDGCGEYYSNDDGPCCSRDCDCVAPGQSFVFPIEGGASSIRNDERYAISLAAGVISAEALEKIQRLIRDAGRKIFNEARAAGPASDEDYTAARGLYYAYDYVAGNFADSIGPEWQGRRGNFTKRLSRFAYNAKKISLPPTLISEIGNVARAQSNGTDVSVEMTRDLNQSPEDFFHSESCWWTDYSESRCALKNNGGIGMRTFGEVTYPEYGYQHGPWKHDYGRGYVEIGMTKRSDVVTGRAWVMPVRRGDEIDQRWYDYNAGEWTTRKVRLWEPTTDTVNPDGYIVFNGYGALSDYAPARIVAQMTGMTYRKVGFECDPMYVNNGGYLVTSEAIASEVDDNTMISLSVDTHANLYNREMTNA